MRYTIFKLDDSRDRFTVPLERYLFDMGWRYRSTEKVNGSHRPSLEAAIAKHGYEINWRPDKGEPRVGQLGIWYSVLNSFELAPHITFEDDAILGSNFSFNWQLRAPKIPEDTDFFSLFLPRDSDHLYTEDMGVNKYVTRTYQRYGGVSMYYTQQGVDKIRKLLERDGITDQYDNTLYAYSKAGELNGYCSKPQWSDLVYITGEEESTVQETEIYARTSPLQNQ